MFSLVVILPLLIFLPLYLSVAVAKLSNAPVFEINELIPLYSFIAILLVVWAVLKISKYKGDIILPAVMMILCGIGIAIQFRIGTIQISESISPSQLAFPIGIVVMLGTYLIARHGRLKKLEPYWLVFLLAAMAVILFVLITGRKYRGATYLAGNINPVEIIKPLLIVFIASMIVGHSKLLKRGFLGIPLPPLNIIVTIGMFWAPPMIMLILQGDMGMFALMNATLIVMIYAATGRSVYLLGGLSAIAFLAAIAMPLTTRGQARVAAWLDPFSSATGTGWQQLQGLVALYSGGLFGTGMSAGSPSIVPIVESDFAYIIIGEELGFIGCIIVVIIYGILIRTGMRASEKSADLYCSTVATGITACLALQIILNIGGVVKAIPLTGIPLPLISHGGSSLVTTLLMAGILLAVSDEKH